MKMNERQVWQELWRRLHIDLWLFIGLVVITGYGMLVLYSASGANEAMFQSRIIQVVLGFTVMLVIFISALRLIYLGLELRCSF